LFINVVFFCIFDLAKLSIIAEMNSQLKKHKPEKNFEGSRFREEVFSKVVRAGKRTYFFDVKSTRNDELYLTITESKRQSETPGSTVYEKHKIFLYREDFDKFKDCLSNIIEFIEQNQPKDASENEPAYSFSDIEFDDLEDKN
jgi:hypothetical protein